MVQQNFAYGNLWSASALKYCDVKPEVPVFHMRLWAVSSDSEVQIPSFAASVKGRGERSEVLIGFPYIMGTLRGA